MIEPKKLLKLIAATHGPAVLFVHPQLPENFFKTGIKSRWITGWQLLEKPGFFIWFQDVATSPGFKIFMQVFRGVASPLFYVWWIMFSQFSWIHSGFLTILFRQKSGQSSSKRTDIPVFVLRSLPLCACGWFCPSCKTTPMRTAWKDDGEWARPDFKIFYGNLHN